MTEPVLGVAIVSFTSGDVILDCLESMLAQTGIRTKIVICENASPDDTSDVIRNWAAGTDGYEIPDDIPFALPKSPKPLNLVEFDASEARGPEGDVTLVHAGVNGGFAAGVNRCIEVLARDPEVTHYWIINPDSVATPETGAAFGKEVTERPDFALMGGRVCYMDPPDQIQIDGGTVNLWTGVSGNIHLGQSHANTPAPDEADVDFIVGASIIVPRAFVEKTGPMTEDYFLYYEEVDWAFRRGTLPLLYCKEALVYHRAGTAIGSPTLERVSSPFSMYFKNRGRMKFLRRFNPKALPVAWAFSMGKAAQAVLKGAPDSAWAAIAGIHGFPPPKAVKSRLSPEAAKIAFGRSQMAEK